MSTFENLSEDQKSVLKEFRTRLGSLDPVYDDFYLYRFLKARDFHLEKGEYMIREHFKVVQLYGLHSILEDYRIPDFVYDYSPFYYIGTDKNGNAVLSFRFGSLDFKGTMHCMSAKTYLKNTCYLINKAIRDAGRENKETGKKGRKFVLIVDLEGLQYLQLLDKKAGKFHLAVVRMLDLNYPEMLECCYLLNMPSFFPPWFNVLKRITNSDQLKKVKLYSRDGWKEELLRIIDAEKLPAIFGGKLTDPDGCTDCRTMYVKGGKIPESFYISAERPYFKYQENVVGFLVREKSFFNHELFVKDVNSIISWSFQTCEHNIGFGIYYVPLGVKPMPKTAMAHFSKSSVRYKVQNNPKKDHVVVVPVQRIDSHSLFEEGEYVCDKPGTYLIHFDNTFSWITPKQLYYKIEIVTPDNQMKRLLYDED